MDFVIQLLLQTLLADEAAAVRSLGDGQSRTRDLGNGITEIFQIGHSLPAIVEVPSSALSAAFQQMAGKDATGQVVVIVFRPVEFMGQRSKEHARVRTASGENDVRAFGQRPANGLLPEVDVGVDDAGTDFL